MKQHLPTVDVLSENGRDENVEGCDDALAIDLQAGGENRPAPTPEHLFTAAYAAFFHSALKSLAASARAVGLDLLALAARLEAEGLEKLNRPFDHMLEAIRAKLKIFCP